MPSRGPSFAFADIRWEYLDHNERAWNRVAAERYRRSAGEATLQLDWHRVFLSLTPQERHVSTVDGTRIWDGPLPAGRLFHLTPQSRLEAAGSGAEAIVVYQHPDVYRTVGEELLGVSRLDLDPVSAAADPALAALVEQVAAELSGKEPGDRLVTEWLSLVIAARIVRQQARLRPMDPAPPMRGSEAAIRRVVDLVEARLADPDLGLEELASASGYTVFHFIRIFKKAVGQSPHQYVLSRRIERAKRLLQTSGLGMAEIARACGFRSASAFSIRFRAATGYKPSRYRG